MQNDVSKPARPDAHPGAAGDRNDLFGRTICWLCGWVVALGSTGQDWAMVGADGIYRSTDAGATWTRTLLEGGGYLIGIAAHGSDMVAVGERGLVMRSGDDGVTWTTGPNLPFGQLWGVDFTGSTTFVAGSGGVLARHD